MSEPEMIQIALPTVGDEEFEALRGPLERGWLTQGQEVAEFQRLFAARHGVAHALTVTSCTTALHLALVAAGVGPGDEVIVPAFTWVATANAVVYCGATPVFADVDRRTYNVTPETVARCVTPRTRAAIPVHLFGLCADIDGLREALPSGCSIIEDAACAVGASLNGRLAGGLGELAAFSLHPRKIITTGEGGMVTTNDADLAAAVDRARNHGATVSEEARHQGPQPYLLPEFSDLGFNYRMTDLQGAVGVVQMSRLDALLAERRAMAARMTSGLTDLGWLSTPLVPHGAEHSWQSYVTLVDEDAPLPRNEVMQRLYSNGVSTRPGTHSVTSLEYYRREFKTDPDLFPVSTMLAAQTMALPLHNRMTEDDLDRVIDSVRTVSG